MKILCCCYPLLNSLSLCFYFTIASSRFLYTCNLTNRKRPEDFLVQKESSLVCSASVTMPWVGRASFLPESTSRWLLQLQHCVNALKGRPPFLLSQTVQKYNSVFWCQCPEWGDLHFYNKSLLIWSTVISMCQCPEWGDLHFYKKGCERNVKSYVCVNALNGATSISTYRWVDIIDLVHKGVSMPWMGRPPFLLLIILIQRCVRNCVNALNGATSISTKERTWLLEQYLWGVNALNGATSISTLASGNPHK